MPHYNDWSGRFFQNPADNGELWGSFDSKVDLAKVAANIDWGQTQSNSLPDLMKQNMDAGYWDNNNLPRPEAFAIMVQDEYTNPADTYFQIWDVTWDSETGIIFGQAPVTMSFQKILDNSGAGQSTSFSSIDSVYFQVDSVPIPEPSTGLLLALAMVSGLVVSFRRRFRPLSKRSGSRGKRWGSTRHGRGSEGERSIA